MTPGSIKECIAPSIDHPILSLRYGLVAAALRILDKHAWLWHTKTVSLSGTSGAGHVKDQPFTGKGLVINPRGAYETVTTILSAAI